MSVRLNFASQPTLSFLPFPSHIFLFDRSKPKKFSPQVHPAHLLCIKKLASVFSSQSPCIQLRPGVGTRFLATHPLLLLLVQVSFTLYVGILLFANVGVSTATTIKLDYSNNLISSQEIVETGVVMKVSGDGIHQRLTAIL